MITRRVVIKLSGESLASDRDFAMYHGIADQLAKIRHAGIDVAVVVGGGNLFRGSRDSKALRIPQAQGDRIGMYATGFNGMIIAALCEERQIQVAEITRGPCVGFGIPNATTSQVRAALSEGAVPIISGGLGEPGLSTDGPAVKLGIDIDADAVIMAKHGVSGAYTADPRKEKSARPIGVIKASEAIADGLAVVDQYALELCRDSRTAIHIIGAADPRDLYRASRGDRLGSLIMPENEEQLIAV
jgi:uridylate kinase